jgi:lysyl-tRNA synthetase class 2
VKSKQTMVFHTVILDSPEIPNWMQMNAVAHLSASFASRQGDKLIEIDSSLTNDSTKIPMNIQHAIIIKKSTTSQSLLELKHIAEQQGLTVVCFTKDMQDSSSDNTIKAAHNSKKAAEITWLGIGIYGERKLVEQTTSGFELMG